MIFTINNQTWEIKEVEEDSGKLFVDGSFRQGSTHYNSQTIYLSNGLHEDRMKEVLLHELTHVVLYATQSYYEKDSFSEEELCEVVALYGEKAINLMRKYFSNCQIKAAHHA